MSLRYLLFLLIVSALGSACSNALNVGEKRAGGAVGTNQAASGSGGDSGAGSSSAQKGSSPGDIPETGNVIFFGENFVGGSGLFSLPMGAFDAIPGRFRNSYDHFSEMIPTDEQDVVLVVTNDTYGSGKHKIQKANIQTSQVRELYIGSMPISGLTLSPDRTLLAFSEGGAIRTLSWKTPKAKPRTLEILSAANDSEPVFFNEDTVVFRRVEKSGSRYRFVSLTEGTKSEAFELLNTFKGAEVHDLKVAPAGQALSFLVSSEGESVLYLAKRSGGKTETDELVRVTEDGEDAFEPSFSADGEKLVFWVRSGFSEKVIVHDVAKNARDFAFDFLAPDNRKGGTKIVCPSISASKNSVLFAGQGGTWSAIYRYDVRTGRVTRMTDSSIPPSYLCPQMLQAGDKK